MTNPEIGWLIKQLADPRLSEQAIDDLVRYGSEAVEALCQALGDRDFDVRWSARVALAKIGSAAVEPLCQALGDMNPYVRGNAARTLGAIADARAVEALCQALGDRDFDVRWSAGVALAKIGDKTTLPRRVLAETRLTPQQRLRALEALRREGYSLRDIRIYCLTKLHDRDNAVREGAKAVFALLDNTILLRPSSRDERRDQQELLRAAAPSASQTKPEEMLCASDKGSVPAPQPQKRRGLLARWLGR